uniref:Amino acid transporter transmembrane domain-containing protein n=1 Tax=Lotharella globosa TaxID=91324 RepID=A0A7S3Z3R7_9EUKA
MCVCMCMFSNIVSCIGKNGCCRSLTSFVALEWGGLLFFFFFFFFFVNYLLLFLFVTTHTHKNKNHIQRRVCWCLNREVMHVWVTLLWLGLAYGIACTVDNIAIVIGILGSTTIPVIGYVLPLTFLLRMTNRDQYMLQKAAAVFFTVVICIMCLTNLGYSIKGYAS